jgi:autotransporter-associated beta strand protein
MRGALQGHRGRLRQGSLIALPVAMAALAGAALCAGAARAQDATWDAIPENGNFNNQFNWTPNAVPTGTAFFNASSVTSLTFATSTTVGGLTLNAGASNYTFSNSNFFQLLQFNGAGIVINGGNATLNNTNATTTLFLNTSTAGSATINNSNNGGTQFANGSTAGRATINNGTTGTFLGFGGSLIFQDTSTAAGATINNNNGGTVQFFNTSTAGSAAINNNTPACTTCAVTFSDSSSAGSATITDNSGSSVRFQNASTAGSATIINNAAIMSGGSLSFVDTSTAGSAAITNNNGGFVQFTENSTAGSATITNNSGSTVAFFNNSTPGSATITNNGGGVADFSGTSGPAGNRQISVGSIAGAGNFYLGANTLTVGGNNLSSTVSGVISDCGAGGTVCEAFLVNEFVEKFPTTGGALIKVGAGTLKLSGADAYTGATTVGGGTLEVDGSIARSSLTTVNFNATLSGVGTVGNTQINGGGVFVPGTAGVPGTSTTVAGKLALQPNAQYAVFANSSTSTFADVTGTASLAGSANVVFNGGFARQYTILKSAGLGGTTFSGLANANLPAGFFDSLRYGTGDVFLDLTAALGATTPLNRNQQNVANTLNSFFNAGGTLPPVFLNLFNLSGANLAGALTQINGQPATAAQLAALKLTTSFLQMMSPFGSLFGGAGGAIGFAPEQAAGFPPDIARAYDAVLKAPPQTLAPRWSNWASAFSGGATTNGDPAAGSNTVSTSTYGYAAGMDYHTSPDTVFGFALAGGATGWNLAQGLGTGRSDAFLAGLRGITHQGPAYFAGVLSFAESWFTTSRTALGDQLTASFQGQSYAARLEGGYRFAVPVAQNLVGVTPYAAIQVQNFHTPAYSETDPTAGGFGLSYAAMHATDTRGEVGGRFDDLTAFRGMPLILRAQLAWAHDWVSNGALNASFESLPGTGFTVLSAPIPHDSALTSAGAQLFLTPNWSLQAKFDGEFASGSQAYAGSGTLNYTW